MTIRLLARSVSLVSIAVLASIASLACSDDEGDGHDHEHSHGALADECQAIVDACHYKDDGTPGELHDCHETAHTEGTSEACGRIQADCVALCNAAPAVGDGGAGFEL